MVFIKLGEVSSPEFRAANNLPVVYGSHSAHPMFLQRKLRNGQLVKVLHGYYVSPPTEEQAPNAWSAKEYYERARLAAGLGSLGSNDVLSFSSAAFLWGFPRVWSSSLVHITRSDARNRSREGFQIHAHRLRPEHIAHFSSFRVTTLARTAVDLACSLPPNLGLAVLDFARKSGASRDELRAVAHTVRGNGRARVARLIEISVANSDSVPESETRYWLHQSGLSPITTQHPIRTRNKTYRADAALARIKLACEFDGKVKYMTPDDLFAEKIREDAIREMGWTFIRVTSSELRQPVLLMARFRALARKLETAQINDD